MGVYGVYLGFKTFERGLYLGSYKFSKIWKVLNVDSTSNASEYIRLMVYINKEKI